MMTIATDEAVQMLQAGWTVKYHSSPVEEFNDKIRWRSPDGLSGSGFHSDSLDDPPKEAVALARRRGDIVDRPRVPTT